MGTHLVELVVPAAIGVVLPLLPLLLLLLLVVAVPLDGDVVLLVTFKQARAHTVNTSHLLNHWWMNDERVHLLSSSCINSVLCLRSLSEMESLTFWGLGFICNWWNMIREVSKSLSKTRFLVLVVTCRVDPRQYIIEQNDRINRTVLFYSILCAWQNDNVQLL